MKTEKAIFAGIIGLLVSSFAASTVATLAWVSTSRETLSSLSGVRLQAEKGTLVGHIHAFGAVSNIDDEDPDFIYGQNETLKIAVKLINLPFSTFKEHNVTVLINDTRQT